MEIRTIVFKASIVLCGEYLLVLLSILSDLWAGVRKAKKRGEARTSHELRRTVDKIARYYNALLAMTVIDVMQMGAIYYLDTCYGFTIPMFPLVTFFASVGFGLIEVKSVMEKAEDKKQFAKAGRMMADAICKKDVQEACKLIIEYMTSKEEKEDGKN